MCSITKINEADRLKLCYELITNNNQCSNTLYTRFFINNNLEYGYIKSSIWLCLGKMLMVILENSSRKLGDGNNVSIWSDKWIHNRICDVIDIENTSVSLSSFFFMHLTQKILLALPYMKIYFSNCLSFYNFLILFN